MLSFSNSTNSGLRPRAAAENRLPVRDYQTAKTERENLQHILQLYYTPKILSSYEPISKKVFSLWKYTSSLSCWWQCSLLYDLQQQQEQQAVALEQIMPGKLSNMHLLSVVPNLSEILNST